MRKKSDYILEKRVWFTRLVTGEPHIQIPGRIGMQPSHEIPLQYITYTGIKFKCTLINLLIRHIMVASACMKIIEYVVAALVSGVHHSSQVSNLTNLLVIKNAL